MHLLDTDLQNVRLVDGVKGTSPREDSVLSPAVDRRDFSLESFPVDAELLLDTRGNEKRQRVRVTQGRRREGKAREGKAREGTSIYRDETLARGYERERERDRG